MFDSHTHLNDEKLYPQRKYHLQDFFDAGGKSLVNVGVNDQWNHRAIKMAQTRNQNHKASQHIFASIGIHPTETVFGNIKSEDDITKEIKKLEDVYYKNPKYIVAIGECGNDAHHGDYASVKVLQQKLFYAQCILAHKFHLPIIIHSRDNFQDAYEVLQEFIDLKIYFHCRGYGPDEIIQCANTFPKLRIGFCGNISYPRAHLLRESFQTLLNIQKHHLDNIPNVDKEVQGQQDLSDFAQIQYTPKFLLETDAPYLSPQIKRGTINVPRNVIDIYNYISTKFTIPLTQLQKTVQDAFENLYKIA